MTAGGREFQVAGAGSTAEWSFADVGASEQHIEKCNRRWPQWLSAAACPDVPGEICRCWCMLYLEHQHCQLVGDMLLHRQPMQYFQQWVCMWLSCAWAWWTIRAALFYVHCSLWMVPDGAQHCSSRSWKGSDYISLDDVCGRSPVRGSCTTASQIRRACRTSNAGLEWLLVLWCLWLWADRRQQPSPMTERMLSVAGWLLPWWAPLIYLDSVGVHSAWTRVWYQQCRQREWTDCKLCCQYALPGEAGCRLRTDGGGHHVMLWHPQQDCSTRRTAEVLVLNPEVCHLPAWSQSTCANQAWRTACGLSVTTGSMTVQFQTCQTASAAAAAVSDGKLYRRLLTGQDRWALWPASRQLPCRHCLRSWAELSQCSDLVCRQTGTGWSF